LVQLTTINASGEEASIPRRELDPDEFAQSGTVVIVNGLGIPECLNGRAGRNQCRVNLMRLLLLLIHLGCCRLLCLGGRNIDQIFNDPLGILCLAGTTFPTAKKGGKCRGKMWDKCRRVNFLKIRRLI
jgi:hypothetical protein